MTDRTATYNVKVITTLLLVVMMNISPVASAQADKFSAFTNVSVLPMDRERVLESQTVLIQNGRIIYVGPSSAAIIPPGTVTIDGTGKYLMPGLSDMHAHIGLRGRAKNKAEDFALAENQLALYAATGVTLLRDLAGSPEHFYYRQQLESGKWIGPEMYFTTPIHEGENAVWDFSTKVTDPETVEAMVSGYTAQGYQGIKIYHTISKPVFDAFILAANRYELPVIGHVPFEVGIDSAIAAKQYSIEHLRGYDFDGVAMEDLLVDGGRNKERFGSWLHMTDQRMDELVAKTLAAGVWNCPTLAVNRYLFDKPARDALALHPRFHFVHPALQQRVVESERLDSIFSDESKTALRQALPRQLEFIHRLSRAGAGLLIGTDSVISAFVPGFTAIDEMELFAEGGLTNYEVLRVATIGAAESLHIEEDLGTVTPGKKANLILLEGNPLRDLSLLWNLEGTMVNGKWSTRQDMESLLETLSETWE